MMNRTPLFVCSGCRDLSRSPGCRWTKLGNAVWRMPDGWTHRMVDGNSRYLCAACFEVVMGEKRAESEFRGFAGAEKLGKN